MQAPQPQGLLGGSAPFGQAIIDRAIDRAAVKLGEGQSGVVVHLDGQGEVSASLIQRFGDHLLITAAVGLDTSRGMVFDKEHLRWQAEIIAKW